MKGDAIGIHGMGFIGTSTAMAFAHEGVQSICFDIDPNKIALYKSGICNVMNLERWSMMDLKAFTNSWLIVPTNEIEHLKECRVHFIAVNTEKQGKPFIDYIENVLESIEKHSPDHELIIIESTLSPEWIDQLKLKDRKVCIAPRRDWFSDPNHTMRNLTRIYAGSSSEIEQKAHEVLSIVCNDLQKASSMKIACMTKAVENALWFVQLVAVQQLTLGYRKTDVNELLKLVATHPRLKHYYPSIKIGGYCVPLGAEYVVQGSEHPKELTLFRQSLVYNNNLPEHIARIIKIRYPKARIGIMGITYKNDLKVHTLSAVFDLVAMLPYHSIRVHDPYYQPAEIHSLLNVKAFEYPKDLEEMDVLIILTDHNMYYETPLHVLQDKLKPETIIIDNLGVWGKYRAWLQNYHIFGDGTF